MRSMRRIFLVSPPLIGGVVILLLNNLTSEEVRDVWHHNLGSARVSKAQYERVSKSTVRPAQNQSPTPQRSLESPLGSNTSETETSRNYECNFNGNHLRVAVSLQPPLVNCLQDLYGEWTCNGSNIELVRVLERRFNFQAQWVVLANNHFDEVSGALPAGEAKQKVWSRSAPTGRQITAKTSFRAPSGIFGLVSSGRALLSANGVMKTLDRSNPKQLIVSEPFDMFEMHFLLSKSVRDHDHIFIKPFNLQAWLAIFFSAALVVPIFYLLNKTSAHYYVESDEHLRKLTFSMCFRFLWAKFLSKARADKALCGSQHNQKRNSSTDSSLDKAIENMISTGGNLRAHLVSVPSKGERKRKWRLLVRNWKLERKQAKRFGRSSRKSGFFKVPYIIWYVVASLAQQGGETEDLPKASSTRILVAFWWLYLIVVCAIHSGILTANLTFPKQIDFIQKLDDYLNLEASERSSIKLAADKYSEIAHLVSNSDNLHTLQLQELHKQSIAVNFVDFDRHRQRILDEIQQGRCAFIEEKSKINQIISQEYFDSRQTKCLFKSSRFPIDVIPMSLLLSKQLPSICVSEMNLIFRRIIKTGLAKKWRRKFDAQGNDCLNSVVINAGDVSKIEFKHVLLAFWLLLLGAILGSLFLISEIVWLLLIDDSEDDDDEDTSSCTSTSPSSDESTSSSSSNGQVQLGFRRAMQAEKKPIRTLQADRPKAILRKTKRQRVRVPKISFVDANESSQDEEELDLDGVFASRRRNAELRRKRRIARLEERRAKRLKRTVDLIKRVHDGQIYSSHAIKNRVRRASQAIFSHFNGGAGN